MKQPLTRDLLLPFMVTAECTECDCDVIYAVWSFRESRWFDGRRVQRTIEPVYEWLQGCRHTESDDDDG
jgi:hypothetical protein